MTCAGSLEKMSPLRRDTAGDSHRVIDPAERKVQKTIELKKNHRKAKARAKAKGRRVKLEGALPIQEVYRGNPEERKSHMNVPLGSEVLDCGAPKSLAGGEPAAVLAQACEKRGRKARDDRKVDALEEKNHFRGTGEQVITSFTKLHVSGPLG